MRMASVTYVGRKELATTFSDAGSVQLFPWFLTNRRWTHSDERYPHTRHTVTECKPSAPLHYPLSIQAII